MADVKKGVHWIEVQIRCNGEIAEALADVLGRFVSNGVALKSVTQYSPETYENEPTGELIVFGYLPVNGQLEEKRQQLEEALWHLSQIAPIPKATYTPIHDEDWMSAWKTHYSPIPIGKRIMVMPAWKQPEKDEVRAVIRINPAMAFGTGTHPTTQLCLELLESHLTPGVFVMDIGCGSGILSIAAIKLGAAHALAVDISEEAVSSTLENAQLNDLPPSVLEVGKGSVEEILTGRFTLRHAPLVMVNILAPVIRRQFEIGLGDLVSPGGKLLLSGILDNQMGDVLRVAVEKGFREIERISQEDWVASALVLRDSEGY